MEIHKDLENSFLYYPQTRAVESIGIYGSYSIISISDLPVHLAWINAIDLTI